MSPMLTVAILALALLAIANFCLEMRIIYPPVVFCLVWALDLGLLWIAGKSFFPLTEETLVIFCSGAVAFSLGSATALLVSARAQRSNKTFQPADKLLTFLVFILAASMPFAAYYMIQLASAFNTSTLLLATRMAMLNAYETGEQSLLLGGVMTLSLILATVTFLESHQRRTRAVIAISAALVINFLSGGRGAIITLGLSLLCIYFMTASRVRWRSVATILLILLAIFASMAILVQKGDARADASIAENARPLLDGFILYACGGMVGFDKVIRQPNIIVHNWQINRFFLETINRLGGHFDLPSLHAEYVSLGLHYSSNVYTAYFAYLDLGFVPMMLALAFIGFIVCLTYRHGLCGNKVSLLLYAFFFSSIVLTPFNEQFFMQLNYIVKLVAVTWIIYRLAPRLQGAFQSLNNRVATLYGAR